MTEWKKTLLEGVGEVFGRERGGSVEGFDTEREKLHSKIGELTVKLDFLEKNHPELSQREQCKLLGVPRSALTYKPVEEGEEDADEVWCADITYVPMPSSSTSPLVDRSTNS